MAFCIIITAGCRSNIYHSAPKVAAGVRWTGKAFLNDPNAFQFVVIGDRTGGHRPGVFSHAMEQINLLRPEFLHLMLDGVVGKQVADRG